jgi:hypothetical protein
MVPVAVGTCGNKAFVGLLKCSVKVSVDSRGRSLQVGTGTV